MPSVTLLRLIEHLRPQRLFSPAKTGSILFSTVERLAGRIQQTEEPTSLSLHAECLTIASSW